MEGIDAKNPVNGFLEHMHLDMKTVYVEGGSIILDVRYPYSIALERCDTPEKVLGWICHLSSKNWVTPHVINLFVHVAAREHGFCVGVADGAV